MIKQLLDSVIVKDRDLSGKNLSELSAVLTQATTN